MRKLIVVLLAAGISAFGFARGNQNAGDDPFVLDHLSIGVGAGLDGISADIALLTSSEKNAMGKNDGHYTVTLQME